MIIKIDRKYTGKNDTIINLDNNKDIENIIYSTDSITHNLNDILKIENIENLFKLDKKYNNLLKTLNIDYIDPCLLPLMVGKCNIHKILQDIKTKINILKNRNLSYYNYFYHQRCELTGMIKDSIYSHCSTVTGRSTIKKGTNYLTMKKQDRKNIKSIFTGGKIIEIDIVSLEPRILSKFNEYEFVDDVYNHVAKILNTNIVQRKKIKLGLLAIIYGASFNTVKKLSGLNSKECKTIKEYFKIDKLYKYLIDKNSNEGKIENMYGRPIFNSSALINHFIQSSAADCAQLAFNQFLKKHDNKKFRLIAVIHDSIIVDCHPNIISKFTDTYMISEEYLNIKLPIKSEILS
jgi:hypothetical protein